MCERFCTLSKIEPWAELENSWLTFKELDAYHDEAEKIFEELVHIDGSCKPIGSFDSIPSERFKRTVIESAIGDSDNVIRFPKDHISFTTNPKES
jgi:hypothetical protein